jgi:hypothetical protein
MSTVNNTSASGFGRYQTILASILYYNFCNYHRWAHLLTQQTSITVYRLQKRKTDFRFPYIFMYVCLYIHIHIQYVHIHKHPHIYPVYGIFYYLYGNGNFRLCLLQMANLLYIHCRFTKKFKRKTEDQAIFLSTLTVCSSCKGKFVVCPFV